VSTTSSEGEPVGRVERLVIAPFDFWPVELVVRTPACEEVRIPAGCVCPAEPVEGRLIVRGRQSVRRGSS
jgi:hypothetical protein